MSLLGNQSQYHRNPGRLLSGAISGDRSAWIKSGPMRNRLLSFGGQVRTDASVVYIAAIPTGYAQTGYAWMIPYTAGELVSRGPTGLGDAQSSLLRIFCAATSTANLAGGLNGVAPLTGTGSVSDALASALGSAAASLSGTGTITQANLTTLYGILTMIAALTGSGTITNVNLNALGNASAAPAGTGAISAPITAKGGLSATITVSEALSTANVGAAVWSEVIEHIGSGASYNARQIMRALFAILDGKVTGGPDEPVFVSPSDGTTPRCAITADSAGNRTIITLTLGD